jgi:hypothetical protein
VRRRPERSNERETKKYDNLGLQERLAEEVQQFVFKVVRLSEAQ